MLYTAIQGQHIAKKYDIGHIMLYIYRAIQGQTMAIYKAVQGYMFCSNPNGQKRLYRAIQGQYTLYRAMQGQNMAKQLIQGK